MSSVHKFTGNTQQFAFSWQDVTSTVSTDPAFEKHIVLGQADGAPTFVIRYFQLPVGGASPLHQHPHEHGIIALHGTARVCLNDEYETISAMDAIFISGGDLHQVKNIGQEPFGFFCTVPTSGEY